MREITESYLQQECMIWLNREHGMIKHAPNRWLFYSVPNELSMLIRSCLLELKLPQRLVDQAISIALKKAKNTGFTAGVSDVIVCGPGPVTLYIEFKTATGKQSPEQIEFQSRITSMGHHYYLCRSLTEFQSIIKSHE